MATLKDLAKSALNVQGACNLTGVVHSFSKILTELRALEPDKGTDYFNRHPISVLFSSKIASLTYSDSGAEFSKAYNACELLAKD